MARPKCKTHARSLLGRDFEARQAVIRKIHIVKTIEAAGEGIARHVNGFFLAKRLREYRFILARAPVPDVGFGVEGSGVVARGVDERFLRRGDEMAVSLSSGRERRGRDYRRGSGAMDWREERVGWRRRLGIVWEARDCR